MKEKPIAVISAASRGEARSGLYPILSIVTLIAVQKATATTIVKAIEYTFCHAEESRLAAVPSGIASVPKRSGSEKDPSTNIDWAWKLPSMKLSPWAKLISSMIP